MGAFLNREYAAIEQYKAIQPHWNPTFNSKYLAYLQPSMLPQRFLPYMVTNGGSLWHGIITRVTTHTVSGDSTVHSSGNTMRVHFIVGGQSHIALVQRRKHGGF